MVSWYVVKINLLNNLIIGRIMKKSKGDMAEKCKVASDGGSKKKSKHKHK